MYFTALKKTKLFVTFQVSLRLPLLAKTPVCNFNCNLLPHHQIKHNTIM